MPHSQRKGKNGELQLCQFLREQGLRGIIERSQQHCGKGGESGDLYIPEMPWLHLECKRTERMQPYSFIEQAELDARAREARDPERTFLPIVFARSSRKPWIMICEGSIGADLLRGWQEFVPPLQD